jgi:hypothetical protein
VVYIPIVPIYYLTNYLIILKIKEMFYQRNLTKYIKRYIRKKKKAVIS